jgi:transposase
MMLSFVAHTPHHCPASTLDIRDNHCMDHVMITEGVMLTMNDRAAIRYAYSVEQRSIRQICRDLNVSRQSIRKALDDAEPAAYTLTTPRAAPKLDGYRERIQELLHQNDHLPRKQRDTAQRIFHIIQREGFTGSASTVRGYVGKLRRQRHRPATFLPLTFDPGQDAQVDWGEAVVDLAGTRVRVQVFVMTLCSSRRTFVMAFPTQRQACFLTAHEAAFRFFAGVPHRISYDNLTTAVPRILRGTNRQEQDAFIHFRSHSLFESHFCTPNEPQEKGRVEHRVGFSRRQYFVPIPQAASFAALNAYLHDCCEQDDARVVHGTEVAIGCAWQEERPQLRPLPARPLNYAVTRTVRLNRYSQVEFETNRYSVPVDQARATLTLQASPFEMSLLDVQQVLATHPRCSARQHDILNPLHYLPLLRQRPGAFAHATPLRQWRETWPADYERLLTRFQTCHPEGRGVREFLEVRSLHRSHPADVVAEAIEYAVAYGCRDAASVLTLLHQLQSDHQPHRLLDLTTHPHLQAVAQQPVDLDQYDQLFEAPPGVDDA